MAIDDRWRLLPGSISAVAIWSVVPDFVWFAGTALLSVGVAGSALRWPTPPWPAEGSTRAGSS